MPLYTGALDVSELTLEVFDDTTVAHLTLVNPAGTPTVIDVEKHDSGARWTAEVTYDRPGLWEHLWSVTGKGRGSAEPRIVSVAPLITPPGRRYATTTDLAVYLDAAVPDDAGRLLERATERVDEILMTAVYDVDEDGMPTDSAVVAALVKATCAQVAWYLETGDDGTGASGNVVSASIGGVSIGYGSGDQGGTPRISPDVRSALSKVGLLNRGPWSY